jgi:HisJ family histidinol phosphate phosphatase
MDDYGKELDFIAGTIHEWKFGYPITSRKILEDYAQKVPITQIVNEYFEVYEKMISSGIFKNVCHIDTIFRYINEDDIVPPEDCDTSDERVIELGRHCIKNNINIEYNLSGKKFPINRSFPSKDVVRKLSEEGAKFFVGSDSHKIDYFRKKCPKIIEAYNFLHSIRRRR